MQESLFVSTLELDTSLSPALAHPGSAKLERSFNGVRGDGEERDRDVIRYVLLCFCLQILLGQMPQIGVERAAQMPQIGVALFGGM
jgi:hypothetical protein